jgi:hypothetical protein
VRRISSAEDYLLPVPVLSRLFRGKMLALLKAAHAERRLQFFGPYTELADNEQSSCRSSSSQSADSRWLAFEADGVIGVSRSQH